VVIGTDCLGSCNKSFTDHTKIRIRELTFNFLGSMFFSLKISVDKI
jgi:hypothetical protein